MEIVGFEDVNNLKEKNLFFIGKEWFIWIFIYYGVRFKFFCKLFYIYFDIK